MELNINERCPFLQNNLRRDAGTRIATCPTDDVPTGTVRPNIFLVALQSTEARGALEKERFKKKRNGSDVK